MTRKEALNDLKTLKDFFIEQSDATPLCLDYAIKSLERKYGEWIPKGEIDENNNRHFMCSNCQHGDTHAVGVEVPFYWYCGADMRGES